MAFDFEILELERIREENNGVLTVNAIVEAAKNEASALHKHFDWDDTTAARKYREWQARTLIQKCKIVIESKDDLIVRAYVSVPLDRKEGGYRAVQDVMDDESMKQSLLLEMRRRIAYWQTQHYLLSGDLVKTLKNVEIRITEHLNRSREDRRDIG